MSFETLEDVERDMLKDWCVRLWYWLLWPVDETITIGPDSSTEMIRARVMG